MARANFPISSSFLRISRYSRAYQLRSSFQMHPTRIRTVSSPAFQRSLTVSTHLHLHRHRPSASWCPPHRHSSRVAHSSPDSRRTGVRQSRLCSSHTPRAPHFVDVPPSARDVPSASAPRFAVFHSSAGLTAAPAPNCPFRRMTLRVASTLYDDLHPAALFGVVLADVRMRVQLLGALGKHGRGTRAESQGHFR
ncbi:hypothetical protein EDB86DRAFT_2937485 [Lactarius hatsudake]|nr:hypothetical protein EDB86DRAFT_2937485 [Lactarius hatsudake]